MSSSKYLAALVVLLLSSASWAGGFVTASPEKLDHLNTGVNFFGFDEANVFPAAGVTYANPDDCGSSGTTSAAYLSLTKSGNANYKDQLATLLLAISGNLNVKIFVEGCSGWSPKIQFIEVYAAP
jgi:hypothetical protein